MTELWHYRVCCMRRLLKLLCIMSKLYTTAIFLDENHRNMGNLIWCNLNPLVLYSVSLWLWLWITFPPLLCTGWRGPVGLGQGPLPLKFQKAVWPGFEEFLKYTLQKLSDTHKRKKKCWTQEGTHHKRTENLKTKPRTRVCPKCSSTKII